MTDVTYRFMPLPEVEERILRRLLSSVVSTGTNNLFCDYCRFYGDCVRRGEPPVGCVTRTQHYLRR